MPVPDDPGALEEAWHRSDDDYGQEDPGRYEAGGRYQFKTPYYGFQHVDVVTRHGDRCGGHYEQWFRTRAENWRELWDSAEHGEVKARMSLALAHRLAGLMDESPRARRLA